MAEPRRRRRDGVQRSEGADGVQRSRGTLRLIHALTCMKVYGPSIRQWRLGRGRMKRPPPPLGQAGLLAWYTQLKLQAKWVMLKIDRFLG